MIKIYLLVIFILSIINGCTSISDTSYERGSTSDKPPIVEDRSTIIEDKHQPKVITTAALDRGTPITRKKSSPPASREAVLDLLSQSKSAIEKYDYTNAESLLKRALRIEPGNAWLWHNMAVLKFYQQDYQQAIQQALKSNNLGKNNAQLKKNNSKVIKQSYIELGEPQKAQKY